MNSKVTIVGNKFLVEMQQGKHCVYSNASTEEEALVLIPVLKAKLESMLTSVSNIENALKGVK